MDVHTEWQELGVSVMGRKPKYPSPEEAVEEWIEEWFRWWNMPLTARMPPKEYEEIAEEMEEKEASATES